MQSLNGFFVRRKRKPKPLNEVLDKLSANEVSIIKRNNLVIYAPSLAAMQLVSLLKGNLESILRNNAPELKGQKLSSTQQLSLLVYYSYCYYTALLTYARIKRGCFQSMTNSRSVSLMNKAMTLYDKLEDSLKHIDWEASTSSQLEASEAIADIVIEKKVSVFQASKLYMRLWTTIKTFSDVFKQFFLVEEEDFDYQRILNESGK